MRDTLENSNSDPLTNSSTRFPSGVWRILAVMYSNMAEGRGRGEKGKMNGFRGLGRLIPSGSADLVYEAP